MSAPPRRGPLRRIRVFTDGAARGNPGPAGAGVHLEDEHGVAVDEAFAFLGEATNNVAEYRALLLGLERARKLGVQEVEIRSDSELVVRQLTGEYRVRNADLLELYRQVVELERAFQRVEYIHIPRAQNRAADRLANRAIDLTTDAEGAPAGPDSTT